MGFGELGLCMNEFFHALWECDNVGNGIRFEMACVLCHECDMVIGGQIWDQNFGPRGQKMSYIALKVMHVGTRWDQILERWDGYSLETYSNLFLLLFFLSSSWERE